MEKYSRLEKIEIETEKCKAKSYLSELNLVEARTKFKLRSRMLEQLQRRLQENKSVV